MRKLAALLLVLFVSTSCLGHHKADYKAVVGALGDKKTRLYWVSVRKMQVKRNYTLKGGVSFVSAHPESKELYVLNPQTKEVIIFKKGRKIASLPTGNLPLGMDISPDGKYLAVANNEDNTVSVFQRDLKGFGFKNIIKAGKFPVFVKFISPVQCLVSNNGDRNLSLIDLNLMKEIRKVDCGFSPFEIELDPERKVVYTACFSENIVAVNSLNDFKLIAKIPVGEGPYGVARDQNGRLFVSNSDDGSISVVDLAKRKEIQQISVGGYLAEMELTPDDESLLILNRTDRKVLCFSPQNLTKLWEMQLKGEPCALGITE